MKTALEQAIDYIYDEIMFDKINGLPRNEALYGALAKCKELLEEEKMQIKIAYEIGNMDYASFDYYAENSEEYYTKQYEKQ